MGNVNLYKLPDGIANHMESESVYFYIVILEDEVISFWFEKYFKMQLIAEIVY